MPQFFNFRFYGASGGASPAAPSAPIPAAIITRGLTSMFAGGLPSGVMTRGLTGGVSVASYPGWTGDLVDRGFPDPVAGAVLTRGLTSAYTDLRQALVAYLKADALLMSIVNTVRPGKFAETDKLPAITYRVETDPHTQTLDGGSGTAIAHVDLGIYSRTLRDNVSAKKRVESLLNGFRGSMAGLAIGFCVQVDEKDNHDFADDGSDRAIYEVHVFYEISHQV